MLLLILLVGPREFIQDIISTVEDFCGIPDLKTRISLFWMSFMSKTLPLFSKFLHLCKIGPILLLILLVGPREFIQDIISTVEDFCGIPDLKTRISLFWMSFMSKTLPLFSKFLHLCKIGPILLLILLVGPREFIQDIISTVEDFCGIPDLKTRISLFWMSFMSKTLPLFSKFVHLCKIGPIMLLILLGGPRECIQDIISTEENFCGIPDLKTRISLFWMSFMSKTLLISSKFLHLCKIGPILLLILLGGPRECIQDIISTVEDFCGTPDLKTRISLFWMSFMSKTLPIFSKFLHLCKIGPIMLLILLVGPRECIQDIISTVEDFCGIPDLKTRISLFWMSFMSKTLPNFSKFLQLCKIGPILLLILLGDLGSVSKT